MVDIARDVCTALTVYGLLRIKFEQVLSAAAVGLFLGDDLAPIFCDDCGFLDKSGGKKPETVRTPLHLYVLVQQSLHDRFIVSGWKFGLAVTIPRVYCM